MPTANDPGVAVTEIGPVPVPEAGEMPSQEALSLADQARTPPPTLEILTVCVLGLLPPCTAVNERVAGLALIIGGREGASTVRLTGMMTDVAPAAVRLIVVL